MFQLSRPNQHQASTFFSSEMRTESQLREIELSECNVANCLSNLNTFKASGPDEITARLLKECSQCHLSSTSHYNPAGFRPSGNQQMSHRSIKRIPKSQPKTISPFRYCQSVKFWNGVCTYDHILNLVSQTQHGFLCKRSCVTQLLSALHTIGYDLVKNTLTDVLYLDFAKAFDSVDHTIVLEKLRGYGVTGPVLGCFKDYLSGRTQRVVVEGVASRWSPVTSGVPQGSILGPLLFIIFINDLPDVVQHGTETAMYADDTKLQHKITSTDDCKCLQQSLTNLNSWSTQNNIRFNVSKCKVFTVVRKRTPVIYEYKLGTETLTRADSEKDLGVITSSRLSWELHVNSVSTMPAKY